MPHWSTEEPETEQLVQVIGELSWLAIGIGWVLGVVGVFVRVRPLLLAPDVGKRQQV